MTSNAPWLLTVGNSSHDRQFVTTLGGFSGGTGPAPGTLAGRGLTGGLNQSHRIVYAKGYRNIAEGADDGRCLQPFRAGVLRDMIVVCDRGESGRLEKSLNVVAGGAAGFVLANTAADGESIVADPHGLPAVHLGQRDAAALKTWLAGGTGHMATIGAASASLDPSFGDVVNSGSSRGPTGLGVLKPDVTAPGTNILAAGASGGDVAAQEFTLRSGTLMASPHAAGAAALRVAARPAWSPAAIHSALMTTARHASLRKSDATTPADGFDAGAGHIDVATAARAGLLLEETVERFRAAAPNWGGDATGLNLASLEQGRCMGACAWERTVTSALDRQMAWTVRVTAPGGMRLTVRPEVFTLDPGEFLPLRIDAEVLDLPPSAWVFARLDLVPGDTEVPSAHLPVALRPVRVEMPARVIIETDRASGEQAVRGLRSIAAGALTLDAAGMVAPQIARGKLDEDPTPGDPLDRPEGVWIVSLNVPAGTRRLVAEIVASEAQDLDLGVGRDRGDGKPEIDELECASGGTGWDETCQLLDPEPGAWWALVQSVAASNRAPDDVSLAWAAVPGAVLGNLTARGPAAVALDTPFDLTLEWLLSALRPGDRWYGAVALGTDLDHSGNLGLLAVDLIGVTPGPTATATRTATTTRTPTIPLPYRIHLPFGAKEAGSE